MQNRFLNGAKEFFFKYVWHFCFGGRCVGRSYRLTLQSAAPARPTLALLAPGRVESSNRLTSRNAICPLFARRAEFARGANECIVCFEVKGMASSERGGVHSDGEPLRARHPRRWLEGVLQPWLQPLTSHGRRGTP